MSGFAPTPEQARAADPKSSVWVTANAGTGKTRVLADRVLRLLLAGVNPEGILCLTFTKAAAVEMTSRIERDLADWAVAPEVVLNETLSNLEGVPPNQKRMARARQLFAQVLDLPNGLPIMTIHSFCASLLRRFPLEAGIAPHFDQIDDRTAAELMAEARMWLLGQARANDPSLERALDELTAIMAEMTLTDLLQTILRNRGQFTRAIDVHQGIGGIETQIDHHLGADPNLDPAGLIRRACTPTDIDITALKEAALRMEADGSKTDQKSGTLILNWLKLPLDERVRALSEYKSAFLTQKGVEKKSLLTKKLSSDYPEHANALLREQVRLIQLELQIKVQQSASRSKAIARVGHALIGHYTSLKNRDSSLDFEDLIEKTGTLLATKDSREWVLYKLDARLEHLLVDEAQDTSPSQWVIIESLLDEFGAGIGAHEQPRTLFVVGDEKQSIYSFQGADLENFRNVAARIKKRLNPRDEALAKSFRTSRAPLELVDSVLSLDEVRASLGGDAQLPPHATSRIDDQGEVVLWPLMPATIDETAKEPWALPGAQRFAPSAEENLARCLAKEVETWLSSGVPLPATGLRPKASDVLILVSRRGRIQELIIRALKHRNVPVAGADRLQLTDHIAVQDLIALGHALLLPEDDLNLACLLKSPLCGLDDAALFELAYDRGKASLIERLRQLSSKPKLAKAYARFEHWRKRADFVPPYELYCEILNEGGRERLLARLGPDAAEPIEAFLSQTLAYEEGHPATLQGFLHWLTLDDQTLKRDPEQARSEVRVMTVHGAKGLEAPFVILADAASPPARHNSPLIFDASANLILWRGRKDDRPSDVARLVEQEDERLEFERARLLYVAITRAKDRLLIAGWKTKRAADASKGWYPWIEQAFARCDNVQSLDVPSWSEDGPIRKLERGDQVPVEVEEKSALIEDIPLPDWASPMQPEPRQRVIKNPSQSSDDEAPAPSPSLETAGRQFGIELHRLLHQLAEIQGDVRERVLGQALKPLENELDINELGRQVRSVLDMPELGPAFAPGSLGEQPIIGRIGETIVSGQIDRLAVTDEAIFIVDFKSNRRPPLRVEATQKAYVKQLAAYAYLLKRIYPGREVRCALVWTVVPSLQLIPASMIDAIELN